jgi:hypothetical protein
MMGCLGADEMHLSKMCFIDMATLNLSGKLNRYNVHYGELKILTILFNTQHVREGLNMNVYCAVVSDKVHGLLFYVGETINIIGLLEHVGDFTVVSVTRREAGNCFPIAWCIYPQRVHNYPEDAVA